MQNICNHNEYQLPEDRSRNDSRIIIYIKYTLANG
jgi:hypothetical protein